jgi:plastocyanin
MSSNRSALAVLSALVVALAAAGAAPAAEHQVTLTASTFSPANLEIQTGDTVTWTNTGGLAHNVRADNGSFRCANGCDGQGGNGEPATNWSFSLTFDDPGTIPYHCQVHGAIGGFGMAGTIVVGSSNDEPGSLRFSTASTSVVEGGTAVFTVQRVGGDDGAVSVSYSTGGGSATANVDYTPKSGTLSWPDNDDDPRNFTVTTLEDTADEPDETVGVSLFNPTGGASLSAPSNATLTILDDDEPPTAEPGTLAFDSAAVSVGEGAGSVDVGVNRGDGTSGPVSAQVTSSDGSAEAGSDYQALSTSVAFADGESGSKDVSVTLFDDAVEEGNETFNLTLSGPTGGAALGDPSAATVTILDDDLPPFPCMLDEFTLCLLDDRFRVQVDFRPPGGELQRARKIDFTNRAGLFWFFNEQNVEMLVKLQDACVPAFDRFWVFVAATTNVEYRVSVIDTQAGMANEYLNPQGMAAEPVQDTNAFATCP